MATSGTYTNPVYPSYFADPFVLKHQTEYYAFGTGNAALSNGRVVEVLHSRDLVTWRSLGGALEPLASKVPLSYWAPEVAFHNGTFYMYYSAGVGDKGHQIRVATSTSPGGPFQDTGRILTPNEPFAIDAHPFQDDGQWYLYYAKDFLEGDRVGTALVVDKMIDMMTLAGEPRTALRASADWQIFQKNRAMYGDTYDWHTLEGPFIRKRDGRYYLFYSGGAWEEPNYGVAYAVASTPLGPFVEPPADGPTVLRSVPGKVIGPGHNSIVQGPDGEDYLVYHAWDPHKQARRMCFDRLDWTGEKPITHAPSYEPQPVPAQGKKPVER